MDTFMAYLQVDQQVAHHIEKENMQPRWAAQRLRLHGGKKRVLARFFNTIEKAGKERGDLRPIVVAYGAAKLAPGGKGEVSVPVGKVYQECKRRFETHLVDEWRSTRVNYEDDSILQSVGVRKRKPDGEETTVRGLLWCSSTNDTRFAGSGKFINRDKNGALNILRCFMLPNRPAILDRKACQGQRLPPASIGAWVRK